LDLRATLSAIMGSGIWGKALSAARKGQSTARTEPVLLTTPGKVKEVQGGDRELSASTSEIHFGRDQPQKGLNQFWARGRRKKDLGRSGEGNLVGTGVALPGRIQ